MKKILKNFKSSIIVIILFLGVFLSLNQVFSDWVDNTGNVNYNVVHTVTFDSCGGTSVSSINTTTSSITLPSNPTKTNNTFANWWTGGCDGSGSLFNGSGITGSMTVYAKWTVTVTFNSDGGTPATSTTTTISNGTVSLPSNPTKAGNTFGGWWTSTGGNGSSFTSSTPVSSDITVYAKWTATVTFDSCGGSAVSSINTTTGSITLPTAPTKAGNTFGGWWTGSCASLTSSFNGSSVPNSMTVYAKWTATNYTVTFNGCSNTGGSMSDQTIASGSSANLTTNGFTRTGYTFAGWATTDCTTAVVYTNGASYTMGTANVNLYAKWTAIIYTVTYNKNGGTTDASPISQTTTYNGNTPGTVSLPTTDPTKAGTTFNGWNTASNGSGTTFTTTTGVIANITVYAQWSTIINGQCDTTPIHYGCYTGTSASNLAEPASNGLKWTWGCNGSGGGTSTIATACQEPYSVTVTASPITYNANTSATVPFTYSASTVAPSGTLSCQLLNFDKSQILVAYAAYSSPISYAMPSSNGTYGYYIRCRNNTYTFVTGDSAQIVVTVSATVTFDSCSGSPATSTATTSNGTVSLPSNPTKSGNTFGGWWTGSCASLTSSFAGSGVTSNVTVYSKWNAVATTPGQCGASHYLCSVGTSASNAAQSSPGGTAWTWMCNSVDGGTNASCTEPYSVTVSASPLTYSKVSPSTSTSFTYTANTVAPSGTLSCQLLNFDKSQVLVAYAAYSSPITYSVPITPGSYGYYIRCRNNTYTNVIGDSAQIVVTVTSAVNNAPVAVVGANQTITSSNTSLFGSGSYDPDGNPITYSWVKTVGGSATFSSSTVANPVITGLSVGSYTFQLTVSDGSLTNSASMTVTVNASNTLPTAYAGSDKTITLPTSTASVNDASASDPDGTIASTVWSIQGYPASPPTIFSGGSTLTPTFSNMATAGTYTFRLTVTDNVGGVSTDDMVVTVNTSANTAPGIPTIGGPSNLLTNASGTFTFVATDSDGDQIKYGIDWDNNGTVDQWLPSSGYTNSNTQLSTTHSWANGTYTFRALAQDTSGLNSGWATKTVTVSSTILENGACSSPALHWTCSSSAASTSNTGGAAGPWTWTCPGSGGGSNASCSESVTSCNDATDNDGDGFQNTLDPSCHTDCNANNAATYDPAGSESKKCINPKYKET